MCSAAASCGRHNSVNNVPQGNTRFFLNVSRGGPIIVITNVSSQPVTLCNRCVLDY